MNLEPLRSNASRQAVSRTRFLPPPVKGWNARSDLSDMEPDEAVVLDNVIPGEAGVSLRKGHASHVTGLGGIVGSLMEYSAPDGTEKLFGATASAIYNVTAAGAVGAANVSSLSNRHWDHSMFATAGGTFLVCVNGADGVRTYNGTAWATQAITGVTAANLITVTSHISRLWFVEDNTMKVWYLPTLSIAGAATSIDFGGLSRLGGHLVAMASWTRDGGSGIDDVAVFLTSKGEVHVYSGSDPSSATTWSRVGTFKIPEPIGRRCFIKAGGDVGILTVQGLLPLSSILPLSSGGQARVAATENIGKAYVSAYQVGGSFLGWQVVEAAAERLVLINVPVSEGSTQVQFVMNQRTGKWCRFTGLNGECWGQLGTALYFGGNNGTVYKYTGTTDLGEPVNGISMSAFGTLGTLNTKHCKRIKPQFFGPSGYQPTMALRFDYDDSTISLSPTAFEGLGSQWDEEDWDVAEWAPGSRISSRWQGTTGQGAQVAVIALMSSTEAITYNGSLLLYELGDGI